MTPLSVICVAPWLVHVAIFVGLLCWYWLAWCGNVDSGRLDVQQGRVASGSTRDFPALKLFCFTVNCYYFTFCFDSVCSPRCMRLRLFWRP